MGRRTDMGHYVNNIVSTLAESQRDVLDISGELERLDAARDDMLFFNNACDYASMVVGALSAYVWCHLILNVGICVLDVGAVNETLSETLHDCFYDKLGFIFLMGVLAVATFTFRNVIRSYRVRKMGHILRKEDLLRRRVWVVIAKILCKIYDVTVPANLSADVYIGTVVDVCAHVTAMAAPIIALMAPRWLAFYRFNTATHHLSMSWNRICGWCSNAYDWIVSRDYRTVAKVGAVAAVSGLAVGAAWFYTRERVSYDARPLRVVQKRKQRIYPEVPPVRPLDPSELKFTLNTDKSYTPTRTFPEHPTFNGVSVAEASLVRINGQYSATAFRVGNSLVTAMHCIGRDENFPGDGIACYNPEDGKYYWANLEKYFRSRSPLAGGDGVAICQLPNADFFLSRHSCQLVVPKKNTRFAGSYRLQNATGKPNFTFSIGPCDVEEHLLSFKSSVEPGSSGGPIINTDGSVMAVTLAHTQFTNYGLLITDEIRDFLVKGGDAPQGTSVKPTQSQCVTEYTSTQSSDESSMEEEDTPSETGSGQRRTPRKSSPPSKDSIGTTSSEENRKNRRKGKKKPGVGPPPPEEHIESAGPSNMGVVQPLEAQTPTSSSTPIQ